MNNEKNELIDKIRQYQEDWHDTNKELNYLRGEILKVTKILSNIERQRDSKENELYEIADILSEYQNDLDNLKEKEINEI